MKILLLSCFTGEGHNSAARAIEEELKRRRIACELTDPVAFQSERARHWVSSCYNNMIKKVPGAFGALYKAGDLYSSTGITSPVYLANAHYARNLYDYIRAQQFDAVISTHLYGMEAMTAIRKRLCIPFPSYGVLTDYTCIPFFTEVSLDGYFVPHEEIRQHLIRKGVSEECIYASGIPVSAKFQTHTEKRLARQVLCLPQEKKVYLLMSGGVGCENIFGLCDALLSTGGEDVLACVLVGRNEALRKKLEERYGTGAPLRTVSFTTQVNLYMNAADVMISKPGGLSSTEAAVANVPLVHFGAIPGCETKNAAFFSGNGMSLWAKTEREAIAYAEDLAHHQEKAERMRTRQRELISPNAAETIVRRVAKE